VNDAMLLFDSDAALACRCPRSPREVLEVLTEQGDRATGR
jgi:hypothetical protein